MTEYFYTCPVCLVKCCGIFILGGKSCYHTTCGHELCETCWPLVHDKCPTCRQKLICDSPYDIMRTVNFGIPELTCYMCKINTKYPFPVHNFNNVITKCDWGENDRFWYFENGYVCDTCMSHLFDYHEHKSEYYQVKDMMLHSLFDSEKWNSEIYSSLKWGKGEISPFRMKRDLIRAAKEIAVYRNIFREVDSSSCQFQRVSRYLQDIEQKKFEDKTSIYNVISNDIFMSKCIRFVNEKIFTVLKNLEVQYKFENDEKQLQSVQLYLNTINLMSTK